MFKKAYVEITNICNLSCDFCHGTRRTPRRLTAAEFDCIMRRLKGHAEYVYFHILGEPLTHPELSRFLSCAAGNGMKCCITTNGTLLAESESVLLNAPRLHKLSVSLHSFEVNDGGDMKKYLDDVGSVCTKLAANGTICALRLWNGGGADRLNGDIIAVLHEKLGCEWQSNRDGFKLGNNLYLENAAKFEWPDMGAPKRNVQFCQGLRDQIGILCDGTVVPCCLDAEGSIALGNIFRQSLDEILNSERAKALYRGFSNRAPAEELCLRCGYAERFSI